MREISPAENRSVDDVLKLATPEMRQFVSRIREEKMLGTRPRPSHTLIDRSNLLNASGRRCILDRVANLVDENLFGRAEMCMQFADLLQRALAYLSLPSRSVRGKAIYYSAGKEIFRWDHVWVRIGGEVVDGNVDSLSENPLVPLVVKVLPYWGPIVDIPSDRRLREDQGQRLPADKDVSETWWPELHAWLEANTSPLPSQRASPLPSLTDSEYRYDR